MISRKMTKKVYDDRDEDMVVIINPHGQKNNNDNWLTNYSPLINWFIMDSHRTVDLKDKLISV